MQASYTTRWNGQFTVGARNVLDRDPPLGNYGTIYEQGQHEIYGRVQEISTALDISTVYRTLDLLQELGQEA